MHVRKLIAACLLLMASVSGSISSAQSPSGEIDPPVEVDPLVARAHTILDDIATRTTKYGELVEQRETLEGEERTIIGVQMRKHLFLFIADVDTLVANVLEQQEREIDASEVRKKTVELVSNLKRQIPKFLDSLDLEQSELRAALESAEGEENRDVAALVRKQEELLDAIYGFYLDHLGHLESLGLSADTGRADLAKRSDERAESLAGRLQRTRERLNEAQRNTTTIATESGAQKALQTELDFVAKSLSDICDVMDGVGLESAQYRQLVIRATGEITGDVLDTKVAVGLIEQALGTFRNWIADSGATLVARLAVFLSILAISWVASRAAGRATSRLANRYESTLSELAQRIIVNMASRVVFLIGLFIALSQIGIEVTALLAGLGIAGFIVGFALQDSLGNFAAGAMILMYRPFDVGHVIEVGSVLGTVSDMNLVSTTVLTFDNQTLVVPNNRIWGDVIRNITANSTRRVDLKFAVSRTADIGRAAAIFESILREHPKTLDDPAPMVKVHELTDVSAEFIVRPWVETQDYWEVYWDVTREVLDRLDREGISPGIPRRDVQLSSASGVAVPETAPGERG